MTSSGAPQAAQGDADDDGGVSDHCRQEAAFTVFERPRCGAPISMASWHRAVAEHSTRRGALTAMVLELGGATPAFVPAVDGDADL
jgi:hypothetical protein